jgi:asparagine synthase (glutamine-hydrolysing)
MASQADNTVLLSELRVLLNKVIKQNLAEGLLFSAGMDTSIIAYEALKFKPDLKAITLVFEQGVPEDIEFVKRMVSYLKLDHEFQVFNAMDASRTAKIVINVLKTFDPMQVRHAIPIYIGLSKAKEERVKSVFTGDGMDELFGYPWLFHLSENELLDTLHNMWDEMTFSSIPLGESVGIAIKTPYLDPSFMIFAKKIPLRLKINFEKGTQYGKWLFRMKNFPKRSKSTLRRMKLNFLTKNKCFIMNFSVTFTGPLRKSMAKTKENNVPNAKDT